MILFLTLLILTSVAFLVILVVVLLFLAPRHFLGFYFQNFTLAEIF